MKFQMIHFHRTSSNKSNLHWVAGTLFQSLKRRGFLFKKQICREILTFFSYTSDTNPQTHVLSSKNGETVVHVLQRPQIYKKTIFALLEYFQHYIVPERT